MGCAPSQPVANAQQTSTSQSRDTPPPSGPLTLKIRPPDDEESRGGSTPTLDASTPRSDGGESGYTSTTATGTGTPGAKTRPSAVNLRRDILPMVLDFAPTGVVVIDQNGTIVLANNQVESMFTYERGELLGKGIESLVPIRYRENHVRHRATFFADPTSRAMGAGRDLFGLRKDGSEIPIEIGLNSIPTPDGVVVLAAVVEISARRRLEERFRNVVESAPNGIVMTDSNGIIILVNKQTELMFRFDRSDMIGHPIEMLLPLRYREHHPSLREGFVQHPKIRPMGAGRDLFGRRSDGAEIPVEVALTPIVSEGSVVILASVVDIQERKRAEERFRLVVEAAPSGILMVDLTGKIVLTNLLLDRMFGYEKGEVLGMPVETLIPERFRGNHPSHRTSFFEAPASRSMGAGRDLYGRRKDGSEIPVEIGLNPVELHEGAAVLATVADITERKRIETLQREKNAAEHESRARSALLATMSHEIRTPLTGVVGSLELLAADMGQLEQEQQQHLATSQRCADSLTAIIDDILVFSKLEAGHVTVTRIPFEPRAILDDVAAMVSASVRQCGLSFEVSIDPSVPNRVLGDPMHLRRVLQNLVGNAVKFTHHGGVSVTVCASGDNGEEIPPPNDAHAAQAVLGLLEHGLSPTNTTDSRPPSMGSRMTSDNSTGSTNNGSSIAHATSSRVISPPALTVAPPRSMRLIFSVKDSGIGIPVSVLPTLFRPFVQADATTTRMYGGTGLGLAICKRLVGILGGDITVDSTPGVGSSFNFDISVWLPVDDGTATTGRDQPTHLLEMRPRVGVMSGLASLLPLSPTAAAAGPAAASGAPAAAAVTTMSVSAAASAARISKTILLAEDSVVNTKVVVALLSRAGYRDIVSVPNGQAAVDAMRSHPELFGLILMDCEMPVVDGFQATHIIQHELKSSCPIVAMTANAMVGDRERCLDAGMIAYLPKPVKLNDLKQIVEQWLGRSTADTA